MNKTYKENLNMWALDTDADHILHRVGSDDYTPIRHTTVKDPDEWEEIAVGDIPLYTKAEYKAKVVELIRTRYDQDDENGILRQRDSKPEEFAEFNEFVEQCKKEAKKMLSNKPKVNTIHDEVDE